MSQARRLRAVPILACITSAFACAGCLERRLHVTSDPPGATVWANDVELGVTPLDAEFTFYGDYDVRVWLDGHEPIVTRMRAVQPLHEYPPFDLVATVIPARFEHVVRWHFTLSPTPEATMPREQLEQELLDRARDLRSRATDPAQPAK